MCALEIAIFQFSMSFIFRLRLCNWHNVITKIYVDIIIHAFSRNEQAKAIQLQIFPV